MPLGAERAPRPVRTLGETGARALAAGFVALAAGLVTVAPPAAPTGSTASTLPDSAAVSATARSMV
jgi:hypothetical protein